MLKQLKSKAMKSKLPALILFAVAFIGLTVYLLPAIVQTIQGPKDLLELDADQMKGAYVTIELDTLIDSYAETVRSRDGRPDETVRREYLLPVSGYMIGVEVMSDSIKICDAIVEDTYLYLTLPEEEYQWDGSWTTITGYIQEMDSETQGYYYETLNWYFDDDTINNWCLPLVLKEGSVGGLAPNMLPVFLIVDGVLLIILLVLVFTAFNNGAVRNIKNYVAATPDPEGTMQELDSFYENTPTENGLKIGRKWLLHDAGSSAFLLPASDIAWVYPSTTQHRTNGVPTGKTYAVMICSANEPRSRNRHTVPAKNEQVRSQMMEALVRAYPNAVVGYDAQWDRAFRKDPAAFYQEHLAARQEAERRRAEEQAAAEAAAQAAQAAMEAAAMATAAPVEQPDEESADE